MNAGPERVKLTLILPVRRYEAWEGRVKYGGQHRHARSNLFETIKMMIQSFQGLASHVAGSTRHPTYPKRFWFYDVNVKKPKLRGQLISNMQRRRKQRLQGWRSI